MNWKTSGSRIGLLLSVAACLSATTPALASSVQHAHVPLYVWEPTDAGRGSHFVRIDLPAEYEWPILSLLQDAAVSGTRLVWADSLGALHAPRFGAEFIPDATALSSSSTTGQVPVTMVPEPSVLLLTILVIVSGFGWRALSRQSLTGRHNV